MAYIDYNLAIFAGDSSDAKVIYPKTTVDSAISPGRLCRLRVFRETALPSEQAESLT